MRIAVVDDERPARSELIYLIRQCSPQAEVMEADSSEHLMELLDNETFDACFVDIDLGGANGTTLASMIKNRQPEALIVFATAYREYAVKAFELGAVDYLLKPFDLERVKKSMERLKEKSEERNMRQDSTEIHRLMVNAGASYQVLDISEIVYIETENRACRIHTKERDYIQNESLNFYESHLRSDRFFRIHKSYLVNLDYVVEMVPGFNNGYSLKMKYFEKERLPIGRTQVKEFRNLFFM